MKIGLRLFLLVLVIYSVVVIGGTAYAQGYEIFEIGTPHENLTHDDIADLIGKSNTGDGVWRTLEIGTLGGAVTVSNDMNGQEMIVGKSETELLIFHAFVYADGIMTDLNDFVSPSSDWIYLEEALAIDNSKVIVGLGFEDDGESHVFAGIPDDFRNDFRFSLITSMSVALTHANTMAELNEALAPDDELPSGNGGGCFISAGANHSADH